MCKEIFSPSFLKEKYKLEDKDLEFITESRKTINNIIL
jgi:3-deoxy-D-arabino-heptulosonate 7-phosphate (DAHP) synthase